MTPDLGILIGFARGVLLALRCMCQCVHSGHSGLWIPSVLFFGFHSAIPPDVFWTRACCVGTANLDRNRPKKCHPTPNIQHSHRYMMTHDELSVESGRPTASSPPGLPPLMGACWPRPCSKHSLLELPLAGDARGILYVLNSCLPAPSGVGW